jgi:hypothetical protein
VLLLKFWREYIEWPERTFPPSISIHATKSVLVGAASTIQEIIAT